VAALGILTAFAGAYLMYVAYEAIHNKSAATPVTKAKTAL
jgi:threonine/homoserine/homoserine lactone efflux protein